MTTPLRVLLVEDNPDDALLVELELRRGGFEVHCHRVQTAEEMSTVLKRGSWDVILSDYRLPDFDAPSALGVLHDSGLDIPLSVVSGSVGEWEGVEVMKAGARDYFPKSLLTRLPAAVSRELEEARIRRERARAFPEGERILKVAALAHEDPEQVAWGFKLDRLYPLALDAPSGPAMVWRTGQPQLLTDVPTSRLEVLAHSAEHLREMIALGLALRHPRASAGAHREPGSDDARHDGEPAPLLLDGYARGPGVVAPCRPGAGERTPLPRVPGGHPPARRIPRRGRPRAAHPTHHAGVAAGHARAAGAAGVLGGAGGAVGAEPASGAAPGHAGGDAAGRVSPVHRGAAPVPGAVGPGRAGEGGAGAFRSGSADRGLRASAGGDSGHRGPVGPNEGRTGHVQSVGQCSQVRCAPAGGGEGGGGGACGAGGGGGPGIGIPEEHLERIFERFGRAVSARSYGGLGLGLYLSRQAAEAHGGRLWAEQRPGGGARFTLELPLRAASRAAEESA